MRPITVLLLLIVSLFSMACRTRQIVQNKEKETEIVKETKIDYRDTLIFTPKAEAQLQLPISTLFKCPENTVKTPFKEVLKPKVFSQKSGHATATVRIERDTLKITAECDSLAIAAKIKREIHREAMRESNHTTVEKKEKRNFLAFIGWLSLAFVTGLITRSLIKLSI